MPDERSTGVRPIELVLLAHALRLGHASASRQLVAIPYSAVSDDSVWESLVLRPSDRRFYGDLGQRLRAPALPAEKKST